MKKNLLLLWAISMPWLSAYADDVPAMLVQQRDGATQEVSIDKVRSIKFDGGQMLILHRDNSVLSLALDDIEQITFSSVATAIEALTSDASGTVTITNLAGEVIYQGSSKDDAHFPASLSGTYIITLDGQSHKVNIK